MTAWAAFLQAVAMVQASPDDPEARARLAAFSEVFDTQFDYVCRALQRLGVRPGDLEDLAQEVFVAAFDRFDAYDSTRPIKPWLFAFAVRYAGNYLRLARHRREVPSDPVDGLQLGGVASGDPEREALQRERQAILLEALQTVPLERRSALILHDLDGCEAKEIAEVLSIPRNTVYSRIRVGRDELKRALHRLQLRRGER